MVVFLSEPCAVHARALCQHRIEQGVLVSLKQFQMLCNGIKATALNFTYQLTTSHPLLSPPSTFPSEQPAFCATKEGIERFGDPQPRGGTKPQISERGGAYLVSKKARRLFHHGVSRYCSRICGSLRHHRKRRKCVGSHRRLRLVNHPTIELLTLGPLET